MQFFGSSAAARDSLGASSLATAIRAVKICKDAAMPFDEEEHQAAFAVVRWREDRVREPVIIKVGEPQTRGTYLKKHTTFLVTEERNKLRVRRRFSDFEWLQLVLRARYIGMLIPSLPEKNLLQSESFIQSRIRGLSLFLQHVMASPYLRGDISVAHFFTKASEKDWDAAKKDTTAQENGGLGHKRWIKRIAMQRMPTNTEHELAVFKRQVEQQEKITTELAACAKRLAEKSASMAKDVNAMHALFSGWSVAETTSADRNAELLLALGKTTTVVSHWTTVARHEPDIYELILYESLRYLCHQVKDMKELLVQREAAALQAAQLQEGSTSAASSVVRSASSLASRFRSNSDSSLSSASQAEQNQERIKQAAELVTKALLAEEIERFRQLKTTTLGDVMNQFACAQGQLTKKSTGIWRDHIKAHVTDRDALLESTRQILDAASAATNGTAPKAYFA